MKIRNTIHPDQMQEMIESLKPYKEAFDGLSDHVIITDRNGTILYANRGVEVNTGFSREEVIGKNPGDLWGGQMPKEFYAKMWQTVKTEKKPFVGEVQNKRKDGKLYWQEIHISPILDEQEEIKFYIAIEPNITERKEKEKFRDEFISILGHQLKTPTATIKWASEILMHDSKLTKEYVENLQSIYGSNQALIDLIGDLLAIAKMGSVDVKTEDVDVLAEIEKFLHDAKKLHPKVHFDYHGNSDGLIVHANKSLVDQVIINLISNAAEYSKPENGEVKITVNIVRNGQEIFVENNGLSISDEDKEKIFTKLFRTQEAQTMKSTGSGLGLYIVKMICDKLGWQISFESPRPGSLDGTVFKLHIPSAD
jgi:PAS domain S-box-containing protein